MRRSRNNCAARLALGCVARVGDVKRTAACAARRKSSKTPLLESQDNLRRRIDEAARYVPLENLALSPQCGFASTSAGNVLTQDEQKAKLELVAGTAAKVWG